MMIGIGIDLIQSSRVRHAQERWGERFLNRVFSPAERAYAQKAKIFDQPLAARFAVKEATLKALGIGMRLGIRWQDIETVHDPWGKPIVRLSGRAQKIADEKQVKTIFVSLSHEKEYAVAQVILMGKNEL